MSSLLIGLIKAYQKIFSPDKGWLRAIYSSPLFNFSPGQVMGCRFKPTCSEYAVEILTRQGVLKGTVKTIARLFKCF